MKRNNPLSIVLLAGGKGTRMQTVIPKQYLPIHHKPLALYSFETLACLPKIQDFIVVCEPQYENIFLDCYKELPLQFACPGPRRQDSVFNGIKCLQGNPLVCIHDSARPFIETSVIQHAIAVAERWKAVAIGVKVKSTIKICDESQRVINTPQRDSLWEIQTPQMITLDLLKEGFAYAQKNEITVTDDVSLIELLGKPVKIVEGSYTNIKVTTPEDFIYIEKLIEKHVLL